MRLRFGDYTLDPAAQELRRGAESVHLPPKAMRLLELLVDRRGELVTRGELFERIWPDVAVSEASLKNLVSILRGALHDHECEGRLIHTVHDRGYRFTSAVVEIPEDENPVRAVLRWDDHRVVLRGGTWLIGRGRDCAIRLDDPSVSRHHARIVVTEDGVFVEDAGSRNGSRLDESPILGLQPLTKIHRLRLGAVVVHLAIGEETPTTVAIS